MLFKRLISLVTLMCTACSPVNVLNAVIPTTGFVQTKNIAYGSLPRQALDVYRPTSQSDSAQPVVIFFYGGSWDSGNKKDYLFLAEALTSAGYITVIPNYRVYPAVKFPGFMQDPANAAKWVKDNIDHYGGDPNQVFIMGHSAGAHIGMMLNLNPSYLADVGLTPKDFQGFIGLAGPYDFLPLTSKRLKIIFGPEETRWQSQPIHFVNGQNQPTLLMVGLKDNTVWPRNTFNLAKAIRDKNGPVEVIEYPDAGHKKMVANLAKPFRPFNHQLSELVEFMRNVIASNKL